MKYLLATPPKMIHDPSGGRDPRLETNASNGYFGRGLKLFVYFVLLFYLSPDIMQEQQQSRLTRVGICLERRNAAAPLMSSFCFFTCSSPSSLFKSGVKTSGLKRMSNSVSEWEPTNRAADFTASCCHCVTATHDQPSVRTLWLVFFLQRKFASLTLSESKLRTVAMQYFRILFQVFFLLNSTLQDLNFRFFEFSLINFRFFRSKFPLKNFRFFRWKKKVFLNTTTRNFVSNARNEGL